MSPILPSSFAPGSVLNCFENGAWRLCSALWAVQERPKQWLQKWLQPSHRLHHQTKSSTINFGFWIIANDLNLYAWALMSGHGAQCTQCTSTFVITYFCPWWRCTRVIDSVESGGNPRLHWSPLCLELISLPFLMTAYWVNWYADELILTTFILELMLQAFLWGIET